MCYRRGKGFTLIELLVVVSILSLLLSILVPVLGKVKLQVKSIINANNQRQTVSSTLVFTADNDGWFPESVATVGFDDIWNWSDPRKLVGKHKRTPQMHRAVSEYLGGYIEDASVLYCSSAPRRYKYLQESWDAGDDWDNPDTAIPYDPVGGTFCFWWNYIGYLGPGRGEQSVNQRLFRLWAVPEAAGFRQLRKI